VRPTRCAAAATSAQTPSTASGRPGGRGWSTRPATSIFFFPPLLVLLWLGLDFFGVSFERGERVVSSPWMPVVYPLKGMIPLACALLLLQGVSEFVRSLHAARTGEWPAR
jgi:TRAP-type mannitol/chloroaromatic compound transport system permease small subunit